MKLQQTKIYKWCKKNQFVYFLNIELFDRQYKVNKKLMQSAIKSKEVIWKEMKMVADYWGCKPHHYIRYALFNKTLTKEEILDYIPPYYHYNFYNDLLYEKLDHDSYDNKYTMFKLLKERSIATPEVLAICQHGMFQLPDGKTINENELLSLFANGDKIFLKPIFGQGGKGIIVLRMVDSKIIYKGQSIEAGNIINLLNPRTSYVIQKGIHQREDVGAISPASVNTLRCVTQWEGNNHPKLSVCVMRIGRNGSDVVNSSQGGISVQVDINSGRLSKYATVELDGTRFDKHPDTGFVFDGYQLEGWEKIKCQIIDFAKAMPEIKELAWDIAIIKDGILAIEINLGYGLSHLQICCGGMRRVLNIFPK